MTELLLMAAQLCQLLQLDQLTADTKQVLNSKQWHQLPVSQNEVAR